MLHPLPFCSWTGEVFEQRPLCPFAALHVLLQPGQSGGCETGGCELEPIGATIWPEMASCPWDP